MRYIRYAFLGTLGFVLLVMALANRGMVTLRALPAELAEVIGWSPSVTLPLFVVVLGGIVAGILIGFVWEWLREHKHRAEAATERRERTRLEREVKELKGPDDTPDDDVLALLDGRGAAQ